MTEKEKLRHQLCGRLSNIPECCIEFYCGPWQLMYDTEFGESYFEIADKAMEGHQTAEYVQCPTCILYANRVELRKCTKWCGGQKCGLFEKEEREDN